jgi:hypothetical protein
MSRWVKVTSELESHKYFDIRRTVLEHSLEKRNRHFTVNTLFCTNPDQSASEFLSRSHHASRRILEAEIILLVISGTRNFHLLFGRDSHSGVSISLISEDTDTKLPQTRVSSRRKLEKNSWHQNDNLSFSKLDLLVGSGKLEMSMTPVLLPR